MIVTRRLNDEQDSHCMVRASGNRLPVLTARMQDCEEMTNCIFNAFLLCVSIDTAVFLVDYGPMYHSASFWGC